MSGMTGCVLLRSVFSAAQSGLATSILREVAESVTDSRKGRHWECGVDGSIVWVSVLSTEQHDYDYEELLLQHNLLFEDAPEAFLIACGVRDPGVRQWCLDLAARLADEFDGIDCGFDG